MAPARRPTCLSRFAVAVAAASLLAPAAAHADEVLRLSGTGTALGAMQRLSGAFLRANPGLRLRVLASVGSSGAVEAVARGALDIGVLGRPLEPGERALGLMGAPYARTAFVLAVGPRAGITNMTAEELARIFRGEIRAWPDGERIRVVLRPRTDVDDSFLRSISAEMAAALDVAHAREGMIVALTNKECNEILERTPGSIGPTSLTQVVTEGRRLVALSWNGVAPTLPNLESGSYRLSETLFLAVRATPSPSVRRFIAFLGTAEATKILEEAGNLPLPVHLE